MPHYDRYTLLIQPSGTNINFGQMIINILPQAHQVCQVLEIVSRTLVMIKATLVWNCTYLAMASLTPNIFFMSDVESF